MTKLKVGDRVRFKNPADDCELNKQPTYEVAAVYSYGIGLSLDGGFYHDWRFELVESNPVDPKQSHGSAKPPLGLVPLSAEAHIARAMQHGADKYGPFNWRGADANTYSMMTYLHAQLRHIKAIIDGQDVDPESGEHHMSHVGAGACLFLDAMEQGVLKDDRPPKGKGPEVLARMTKANGGRDAGGK